MSDGLHAELARRRRLAAAVEEEVEALEDGGRRVWYGVYRWDAVRTALNDDGLSTRVYGESMGLGGRYGPVIIEMDPPENRRHREPLQPVLSRSSVAASLRPTIEAPIHELVADLQPRRSVDLVADLCDPMPGRVLAHLYGLPVEVAGLLAEQSLAIVGRLDEARAASDALLELLTPTIRERRQAPPGDDLVSVLAHATIGDRSLTDLEVFSHLRLLAIASTDTVGRATANLLCAMLAHPDQLAAVRDDETLSGAAVDEALRWECPATEVPRLAIRDVHLGGVVIPEGAVVRCNLSAANRDPARWPDPDTFDIHREAKSNAAFGLWSHACLGMHVARLVMETTLLAVVHQLPDVRAPAGSPPVVEGVSLRTPSRLLAVWD